MIKVKNLKKSFKDGDQVTDVLKGIDFVAENGEFIGIIGRSGAGKSTFLYQMSLLDEPTSGEIEVDGRDTHAMTIGEKTFFRLTRLGYVFQDYALLPEMSALENVVLPLLMQDMDKSAAYKNAEEALGKVGLGHRFENLPSQLSGGEQQRVAVARAIAHRPKILFADEPTANLDSVSGSAVIELFKELNQKGQTIVMVTHEDEYAKYCNRIIHLDDGKIVKEITQKV
ncbi:MAG: ABC transporter ATP-binding protein [Patescibacteria group bacterium]